MYQVDAKATGVNIKRMCEQKNYTPKDLSQLLDTALATPYLWFNGEMMPKLNTLVSLSKLLGCTVDELLVIDEEE